MRRDERRYVDRVREAIKNKLPEVVGNSSILTAPPGSKYIVKIPYMEVPYFRAPNQGGSGAGGSGGSGSGGGEPHIELQLSLDEVVELIFASLHLPQLPKQGYEEAERVRVEGITRNTHPQRLHIRRTIFEAAKQGVWWPGVLRYRDVRIKPEPVSSAVVIFARDSSGSMDEERRYLVRVAALWITLWLRKLYPLVRLHFIMHDTEALEVEEPLFFDGHKAGGTLVSSAWLKSEQILKAYDPEIWNRYVIYFSDGENWSEDNLQLKSILARMVPQLELAVYGEVGPHYDTLIPIMQSAGVRSGVIAKREDVANWINNIFQEPSQSSTTPG